jgi:hypothetical protein
MDNLEIKRKISEKRKIKKDLKFGSKERLSIGREIKALKERLADSTKPDKEKDKIISQILLLDKVMASIIIDLKKHNIKDLKKYLDKLKKGGNNG